MIPDAVIQACYQRDTKIIILDVNQNAGTEKDDDSRQSPENHTNIDEIRRFSDKKSDSCHDVHRAMTEAEEYPKPSTGENISGVLGISCIPFLCTEAGGAHMNFEVADLPNLWTERIIEIDELERD